MCSSFPSGNLGKHLKFIVKTDLSNIEKVGLKDTALYISLALLLEMSWLVLQTWVLLVSKYAKERQVSHYGFKLQYSAFRFS